MASSELRKLYRLHLVDSALVEIRMRAAALDPGRKLMAELSALEKHLAEKTAASRALSGEQADIELEQKTIDQKIKKIEAEIYGGKVVNPREVENLQKEVETLKKKRNSLDARLLELMESGPDATADEAPIRKAIAAKKAELAAHQTEVMAVKAKLESDFKARSAERPVLAKEVPPVLMARYDAVRKKLDGVGVTEVNRDSSCTSCGTFLPEKTIQAAKEGRVVYCDTCHRIVYASDGVI